MLTHLGQLDPEIIVERGRNLRMLVCRIASRHNTVDGALKRIRCRSDRSPIRNPDNIFGMCGQTPVPGGADFGQ